MSWINEISEVENDEAKDALQDLHESEMGEKCIIAEGTGHDMVFFKSEKNGHSILMEASISKDWDTVNSTIQSTPGTVENLYEHMKDSFEDVYVSNGLPASLR